MATKRLETKGGAIRANIQFAVPISPFEFSFCNSVSPCHIQYILASLQFYDKIEWRTRLKNPRPRTRSLTIRTVPSRELEDWWDTGTGRGIAAICDTNLGVCNTVWRASAVGTPCGSMFSTIYVFGTPEKLHFAWDSGTLGCWSRVFNGLEVSHGVSHPKMRGTGRKSPPA